GQPRLVVDAADDQVQVRMSADRLQIGDGAGGKVIDNENTTAGGQQRLNQMTADEPRPAGDQTGVHGNKLWRGRLEGRGISRSRSTPHSVPSTRRRRMVKGAGAGPFCAGWSMMKTFGQRHAWRSTSWWTWTNWSPCVGGAGSSFSRVKSTAASTASGITDRSA